MSTIRSSVPGTTSTSVGRHAVGTLTSPRSTRNPAVSTGAPAHRGPRELIALARAGVTEAADLRPDGRRFAAAHLAALRAAAAILSARSMTTSRGCRGQITNVWSLLILAAPELDAWASYFSAGASKRAAAEAGIPQVVTRRDADDLLRAAEQFIGIVEVILGLSSHPVIEVIEELAS